MCAYMGIYHGGGRGGAHVPQGSEENSVGLVLSPPLHESYSWPSPTFTSRATASGQDHFLNLANGWGQGIGSMS